MRHGHGDDSGCDERLAIVHYSVESIGHGENFSKYKLERVAVYASININLHLHPRSALSILPPLPRPLRHRPHQKRNRIIHHGRRKSMSHALIHSVVNLNAPISIPSTRRILQQPDKGLPLGIRHQLIGASRTQKELLAPDTAVKDAAKTVLFSGRERQGGNGVGPEQDALGIQLASRGDGVSREVFAPQEASLATVQLGQLGSTGHHVCLFVFQYIPYQQRDSASSS